MPDDVARPPLDPFAGVPARKYELSASELLKSLHDEGTAWRRWRRQTSNAPIVQVEDRYITGLLDLRAAELGYLFKFERCRFEFPPDFREASLLGLVFRDCWIPGLKARNLRSRNDVRLIRCRVDVEADAASGDSERTVRRPGDAERGVPNAAINLTDAIVDGSVVLTKTEISYPRGKAIQADRLMITGAFLAYRLVAHGEVRVPGMRVGGNVNFSGAELRNPGGFALNGNGLHVGGNLLCDRDRYGKPEEQKRFTAEGVVHLPSAVIDSDLVMREAELTVDGQSDIAVDTWITDDPYVDPRPALVADRLRINGNIEFDKLTSVGTLRMLNCSIGGSLRLANARIAVPRGEKIPYYDRVLHLDGSEINGDIQATSLYAQGQLRLADVRVRGNVVAIKAHLLHRERDVVYMRRSDIFGNLRMTDATVSGTLRLQGVQVGGSLELYGAHVSNPSVRPASSFSVDLRTAKIGRDALFTAKGNGEAVREFYARGGVTLDGATVRRRAIFSGARLESLPEHGIAINGGDLTAEELLLAPAVPPVGRVVLRGARCGTLTDNAEFWHATGKIELDDFQYNAIGEQIDHKDDAAVIERIRLLRAAMPGYRPGAYDQLANMLRASGNEEHADTVLMRKQEYRYEALASGSGPFRRAGVWIWSNAQRWMVGYGYRPMRAVAWMLIMMVAGTIWFSLQNTCQSNVPPDSDQSMLQIDVDKCAVNKDDTGLEWNPLLYTVDLLVPIVDFGNKGRWHMEGMAQAVSAGFTAMGWVLATTVAAGVTRTLRRGTP